MEGSSGGNSMPPSEYETGVDHMEYEQYRVEAVRQEVSLLLAGGYGDETLFIWNVENRMMNMYEQEFGYESAQGYGDNDHIYPDLLPPASTPPTTALGATNDVSVSAGPNDGSGPVFLPTTESSGGGGNFPVVNHQNGYGAVSSGPSENDIRAARIARALAQNHILVNSGATNDINAGATNATALQRPLLAPGPTAPVVQTNTQTNAGIPVGENELIRLYRQQLEMQKAQFESQAQQLNATLSVLSKAVENNDNSSSDKLQGTKHDLKDVGLVIGKLTYSRSTPVVQLVKNWENWTFKFKLYLSSRSKFSEDILTLAMTIAGDAALRYHRADDAEVKAQVVPDIRAFVASLTAKQLDHARQISSDVYALFPKDCLEFARHQAKGRGELQMNLCDLLFLPMRDMIPFDALGRSDMTTTFLERTKTQAVTIGNCIHWLQTWKNKYDDLKIAGYQFAEHTELFRALRSSCEGLLAKGNAVQNHAMLSACEKFFDANPIPTMFIDEAYMFKYYWVVRGKVELIYRASSNGEVNWGEDESKPPKPKPPKPSPTPTPDTPILADVNTTDAKGGGKGGKGNKPPPFPRMTKKRDDMTDDDWKLYYVAVKAWHTERKSMPVCLEFFFNKTCKCKGVMSHDPKAWTEHADKMASSHFACNFGAACVKLACVGKKCPRWGPGHALTAKKQKAEANLVEARSDDMHVYASQSDGIRFLFDECANTNVAASFEITEGPGVCSLTTANGSKSVKCGTAKIAGNELEFIESTGVRNIMSANEVLGLPQVVGYYQCSEGYKVTPKDGNTIVLKSRKGEVKEIVLEKNEKGFPEISEAQFGEIVDFDKDEVYRTEVVGVWTPWSKVTKASDAEWRLEVSKHTELAPTCVWSNTSGHLPPAVDVTPENVVFDLEYNKKGQISYVTNVSNDVTSGPAFSSPWQLRVVRIVCGVFDELVEGVNAVSSGPATSAVSFRTSDVEAHYTDTIQYFDASDCGGRELDVCEQTVHACAVDSFVDENTKEVNVTTRSQAASLVDSWVETASAWVRVIRKATDMLFTPTERNTPFPLESIGDSRRIARDGEEVIVDNWREIGSRKLTRKYTGHVSFVKLILTAAALIAVAGDGTTAGDMPGPAPLPVTAVNAAAVPYHYELTSGDIAFLDDLVAGPRVPDNPQPNNVPDDPAGDPVLSMTRKAVLFRRKKARQKMEARVTEYVAKTFEKLTSNERELIVHSMLDHSTTLTGQGACLTCNISNQRRQSHSHRPANPEGVRRSMWHADTMGKISPLSICMPYVGAQYGICGADEESDRLLFNPVKSKHSSNIKSTLETFHYDCGSKWPHMLRTGNDPEYQGVCKKLYQDKNIHHECTLRHSPWENGTAETSVRQCEELGTAALIASNAPYGTWPYATRHAVDTENLRRGLKLTPSPDEIANDEIDFPVRLMGPYGCKVSVVKEGKESVQGEKFAGRAWVGFLCGYVGRHSVKVGYKVAGSDNYNFVISQNVKVYPNEKFFTEARGENDKFERRVKTAQENDVATWVQTTCCAKWREIEANERSAIAELDSVTCEHVGTTCACAQDPDALHVFNLELVLDNTFDSECYAFEGVSRKVAFGGDEWYSSGKTYKEVMGPASEKEFGSFAKNNTFNMKGVLKRSEVRKRFPQSKVVLTNLIMGTKGVENYEALSVSEKADPKCVATALKQMKAKGRLVAFKEIWITGGVAPGMDPGEAAIANTPSYTGLRCQVACAILGGKVMGDADVDTAYQKAPNLEAIKAWCQLPIDLWPDDWANRFSREDPPLVPIDGSLYGRERAGFDYDAHATGEVVKEGWKQVMDVEPCLFVRPFSGNGSMPDSLARYADDFRIASGDDQGLEHCFASLNKRLPFGESMKSSNGEKFVGLKIHWEKLEDGRWKMRAEQKDLIGKVVNEFKEECEKRKIVFKVRRTPEPATDVVVPCTRQQDEWRAKSAAKVQEVTDMRPTLFHESALHYINTVAFVERGARADLSNAIQRLQSFSAKWTAEADKLLIWLFGYLEGTRDRELIGYIDPQDFVSGSVYLLTQSDASHASIKDTRKSVAGWAIWLKGPRTSVLLEWGTKILPVVTLSSMETEVVGGMMALKRAIPTAIVLNVFLGYEDPGVPANGLYPGSLLDDASMTKDTKKKLEEIYQMDALSAIIAIKKAGSSKVRHIRRTQGVSIFWMHQYYAADGRSLVHQKGADLAADAFTKGLSYDVFAKHMRELGYEM